MRGLSIVRAFLAEHDVDESLFDRKPFGRRRVPKLIKLMRQLQDAGLNNSEIARAINSDRATVRYWLSDDARRHALRTRKATYTQNKIYRWWEECAQAMEGRA